MSLENLGEAGDLTFVYVDKDGHIIDDESDEKFLAVESEELSFDRNFTDSDSEELFPNLSEILNLTTRYMAQSSIGRAAIKIIKDNNISIGYSERAEPEECGLVNWFEGREYILLRPSIPVRMQHILLIQVATGYSTSFEIGRSLINFVSSPEASAALLKAIKVSFISAGLDHGDECAQAQRKDSERFMPPGLEEMMRIISDHLAKNFQIPSDRAARTDYRQSLIEIAKTTLDPKTAQIAIRPLMLDEPNEGPR